MYLAMLNESQKRLFLDLAHYLASIDGNYSDKEKEMVKCYCREMQITSSYENKNIPIEKTLKEINEKCDMIEKKIIVFEAIGLAMADDNYDDSERNFVHSIMLRCGIEDTFDEQCEEMIKEYFRIQNKLNGIVIG